MKFDTEWTLESGPDDAPHTVDLLVDYEYSFGSCDSWMEPGDPPECEVGTAWYALEPDDPKSEMGSLSLVLQGEQGFLEWIANNPPDVPSFEDDY